MITYKQATENLSWAKFIPAGVFMVSIALTFIGIFSLSSWAEASALGHATQHAAIFLGGFGAAISLLKSLKNRKEN